MAGPPDPSICTVAGPAAQVCAAAPKGRARTAMPQMMEIRKSLIIECASQSACIDVDFSVGAGCIGDDTTRLFMKFADAARLMSECATQSCELSATRMRQALPQAGSGLACRADNKGTSRIPS